MQDFQYLQSCRFCGFSDFTHHLHLNPSPLANNFTDKPVEQKKYPLDVLMCQWCGHHQLSVVVDPELLFSNYLYASGPSFTNHWKDYSKSVFEFANLEKNDLICDLGSNDGGLLKCFQELGCEVIGVEPAKNLAEKANQDNIPTINEFFDHNTVKKIKEQCGTPKLICMNNAFAHIDNLRSVVRNVKELLDPYVGLFVFEVQYLVDQIENLDISNFYHEHLSYHHLSPLYSLFNNFGMKIIKAERNKSHNGTIRVIVSNNDTHFKSDLENIKSFIKLENDLGLFCSKEVLTQFDLKRNYASAWMGFREKIETTKKANREFLSICKKQGKIVGFGAAAKSTSLLNAFGIGKEFLDVIIDDAPLKINKYHPIDNIQIVSSDYLYAEKPDFCLILASNFAERIKKNHHKYIKDGGVFISLDNLGTQ